MHIFKEIPQLSNLVSITKAKGLFSLVFGKNRARALGVNGLHYQQWTLVENCTVRSNKLTNLYSLSGKRSIATHFHTLPRVEKLVFSHEIFCARSFLK